VTDRPRTRLSSAAKRLCTQGHKEARRVLDEAYRAYLDALNNDNNSNKSSANIIANNDTNKDSIHPVGTPPPRSPSPAESISSQLTQRIFPDFLPSSHPASPTDSTSSVAFLIKVPPPCYYFHYGNP